MCRLETKICLETIFEGLSGYLRTPQLLPPNEYHNTVGAKASCVDGSLRQHLIHASHDGIMPGNTQFSLAFVGLRQKEFISLGKHGITPLVVEEKQ